MSLVLAIVMLGNTAFSQSNGVPAPDNYASFSQFITDRNIFDPNRVPHSYSPNIRRNPVRTRPRSTGTPGIQLVGTMTYEKGPFAFFNANNSEYRKALPPGEKIAGYTITAITPDSVGLESADKKTQLELKVGDGLQQQGTKWVLAKAGAMPVVVSAPEASSSASPSMSNDTGESAAPAAAPATSAADSEPNDVLKRLMQKREKQNQ